MIADIRHIRVNFFIGARRQRIETEVDCRITPRIQTRAVSGVARQNLAQVVVPLGPSHKQRIEPVALA